MNDPAKTLKTIKDLENLPGDERAELINGEIIMMSPSVGRHGRIQSRIAGKYVYAKDPKSAPDDPTACEVITEAWVSYETQNAFVHDIASFQFKSGKGIPEKGSIKTTPFWVCEIVSPSNWRRDTEVKRRVLERFKVPFLWLVLPKDDSIQIYQHLDTSPGYRLLVSVNKDDGAQKLPPFGDVEIDLADVFG